MKTTLFFFILALFIPSFSWSLVRDENFEYLDAREKNLLEIGIAEANLPSFCSLTKQFAEHPQWNPRLNSEKIDLILVDKKRRLLHLLVGDDLLATYRIALGGNPTGQKMIEGDQKTPEGTYFIDFKNKKSEYNLSLRLNYPNFKDLARSKSKNIKDPGKDIMIHGLPNSWIKRKLIRHPADWTKGCIAVTNSEITQIFAHTDLGTMIEICP